MCDILYDDTQWRVWPKLVDVIEHNALFSSEYSEYSNPLVMQVECTRGRLFCTWPSIEEHVQQVTIIDSEGNRKLVGDLHFHEVILEPNPRYEYFDLDYKLDECNGKTAMSLYNEWLKIYSDFLSYLKQPVNIHRILVLDSSRPSKTSLHIINKSRVYINHQHQLDYMESFKEWLTASKIYIDWIDFCYNKTQFMRMALSSSSKSKCSLVPALWHGPSRRIAFDKIQWATDSRLYTDAGKIIREYSITSIPTSHVTLPCLPQQLVKKKARITKHQISTEKVDLGAFDQQPWDDKGYSVLKRIRPSPCVFDPNRIHTNRDSWLMKTVQGHVLYGCFCYTKTPTIRIM
jgi:hypothetical protein